MLFDGFFSKGLSFFFFSSGLIFFGKEVCFFHFAKFFFATFFLRGVPFFFSRFFFASFFLHFF